MGYFAEVTVGECWYAIPYPRSEFFPAYIFHSHFPGQKLEDMDISVHCDLAIFDWLMRWVKKDLLPRDATPTLGNLTSLLLRIFSSSFFADEFRGYLQVIFFTDVSNAVPILVSAAFLQMDPLLDDCLQFCQANLNAILRSSTNLGCLNDNILSRSDNSNHPNKRINEKKNRIKNLKK